MKKLNLSNAFCTYSYLSAQICKRLLKLVQKERIINHMVMLINTYVESIIPKGIKAHILPYNADIGA